MEYKRNECLKLFGIEMVTVRVFQCRNSTVGGEREREEEVEDGWIFLKLHIVALLYFYEQTLILGHVFTSAQLC